MENAGEDPEDAITDLVEAQETASFFEPDERIALGGLFNVLFSFSTLNSARKQEAPSGALAEAIDKRFSNFDGLKEAFKKTVQTQFLPGWVWLAVTKNADGSVGQLILQQTNN